MKQAGLEYDHTSEFNLEMALFLRAMINLSQRSEHWKEASIIWRAQSIRRQLAIIERMKTEPRKYEELFAEITKLRMQL